MAVEQPVLELDELWSFVLKKARKRSHLDRAVPSDKASGRVRGWGSQPADLPPVVGSDSCQVSSGSLLLHGLLGSLRAGAARRAAHSGGQRVGRDGACRAVESDLAAAASPGLCDGHYRCRSHQSCTKHVYACSFIVTIAVLPSP